MGENKVIGKGLNQCQRKHTTIYLGEMTNFVSKEKVKSIVSDEKGYNHVR